MISLKSLIIILLIIFLIIIIMKLHSLNENMEVETPNNNIRDYN